MLLGNGTSEQPIQTITVGERVATDGGVANSPTGTAAADPNATAVHRKKWREITIIAAGASNTSDWQITVLEPESWIKSHDLADGNAVAVDDFVDLAEMGAPTNLVGTVESITRCPKIQSGPGRVVLATVSHLNDFVFHLTLTNSDGDSSTIGVTGYHKIYTEDRGWVDADDLYNGELVRGAHGDLTVTGLSTDPGMYRVYNLDVEDDHVYYVSDLDALVHNFCGEMQEHHIEPAYLKDGVRSGPTIKLPTDVHKLVHEILDSRLAQALAGAPTSRFVGATEWTLYFSENQLARQTALRIAAQTLYDVLHLT